MKMTFTLISKTLFFSFLIGTAFGASGRTLSPEEALSRVVTNNKLAKIKSISESTPELYKTFRADNEEAVYVFTEPRNGDYLIVSADDATEALLGYGSDFTEINPTMQWWIEEYGRQIAWMRTHGSSNVPQRFSANTVDNLPPIDPMIKTKWNQSAPYNNACPTYNGSRCVTGCVATAMAQVMNYHQWPAKGTGSISYSTSSLGINVSAVFSYMTFDWKNMLDTYGSDATATQQNAVAQLMFACGAATNMNYTPSSSGAASTAPATAMVKYFGYDKGIMYYNRNYYGIDDWNTLIYNQLTDYGPIQYSGQSNTVGHSFVCDGYNGNGYFHFNWGWGGMSDGYFLLTALDPSQQGIGGSTSGYNFSQSVIGNVKPATSTSAVVPNFVTNTFVPSSNSVSTGTWFTFTGNVYNYTIETVSRADLGIKCVNTLGAISYIQGQYVENFSFNSYVYDVQYYISAPNGTYDISPAVKVNNVWYDVPIAVGAQKATKMVVSNGRATFTIMAESELSVTEITPESDFYIGSNYLVKAKVTNTGSQEYIGGVRLAISSDGKSAVGEGSLYPIDLLAGESVEIEYMSTFTAYQGYTLSAGNYYIGFMDESGYLISDLQSITLNAESKPTLALNSFSVDGTVSGGITVVPQNHVVFKLNLGVTAGYFANYVRIVIFPYIPGASSVSSVGVFNTDPVFLSAGQSQDLTLDVDFSDGTIGNTYFAMVYQPNASTAVAQNRIYFTLANPTSAVNDIEVGNDVVETEYYNLSGMKVNSFRGITPGLYIVRKKLSDGTVTTEKVYIRDDSK